MTKEKVNQTELMAQHNALIAQQNHHLRDLALATRRLDEFNRMAYQASSGYQMPDSPDDKEALNDFHETQAKERSALEEMYHSDISLSGEEEE